MDLVMDLYLIGPYRVSKHDQELRWYTNLRAIDSCSTKEVPSMLYRSGPFPASCYRIGTLVERLSISKMKHELNKDLGDSLKSLWSMSPMTTSARVLWGIKERKQKDKQLTAHTI